MLRPYLVLPKHGIPYQNLHLKIYTVSEYTPFKTSQIQSVYFK